MAKYTAKAKQERIKKLIARLNAGRYVQARDINLVLTRKQRAQYKKSWEEQREIRAEKAPEALLRYQSMLQQGLMWEQRAEQFGGRTEFRRWKNKAERRQQEDRLSTKAESRFEDALEYLREALSEDPSLRIWLDREVTEGVDSDINTTPEQMPRLITSRSPKNYAKDDRRSQIGQISKRELKLQALQGALEEMQRSPKAQLVDEATQAAKLAELLKRLK